MNTANLQLEGLYMVVAGLIAAMKEKGVLEEQEIDAMLAQAEASLASDPQRPAEMRGANVHAICFPVRFLRQALKTPPGGGHSFAELAARVGQAEMSSPARGVKTENDEPRF